MIVNFLLRNWYRMNNILMTWSTRTFRKQFNIIVFEIKHFCHITFICGKADFTAIIALRWRHNDHAVVSNHQPRNCLLNRLFRRRSKKTSKLRVTGLCVGNSSGPVNSPHKGPVPRKMFPFDDVIMESCCFQMDQSNIIPTPLLSLLSYILSQKQLNGKVHRNGICQDISYMMITLHWRHNERDSTSNHQPHDYLRNRLFKCRSKETPKLCVTGLCAGNSPETGEFPAQSASNAGNVSIWWRHHLSNILLF